MTTLDFPDFDQGVAEGLLGADTSADPGLMGFLGIRHVGAGPGWLEAEIDVRSELITFVGTLHGGVVSALADHVLGSVMYPVMPRGAWAATTEFKINLLRPVRDGVLRARADVIALSKRTGVVRIDITNQTDDGTTRLAAAAQGTVSIKPPQ
ncbi:MAG: PaaI family thioesterase [Acidimicrobiia bacterium]